MEYIKIYGLPRSCTNITEVIVNKNFKCKVLTNNPDWKHGFNYSNGRSVHNEKVDTDDLKFIICTKHPYRWLWSLFVFERHKWTNPHSLDYFLQNTAWHYKKHNHMTPIEAFNKLTKHWLEMYDDKKVLTKIKQEDLETHEDQIKFCENLEKDFDLRRTKSDFSSVQKIIRPGATVISKDYQNKKHEFTSKQIDYINSKIDKEVVKLAGYVL